jgi:ABC-type transport system involved in multi-copper enzyme maturation permease subunit
MGKFSGIMKWTFQNDMLPPFVEVILFLLVYLATSSYVLEVQSTLTMYYSLSWNLIYVIIFLVAISAVRAFSIATERGEISRQLMSGYTSRARFILAKFLSLYALTVVLLLVVDVVALFVYMGYFFSPSVYISLGTASLANWGISIMEQLLLLFFLDSLAMALSLLTKSTTISLLLFLVITLLGVNLYRAGVPGWAVNLQLGYGDYNIVNSITSYLFYITYEPNNTAMATQLAPGVSVYVGIIYRLLGGSILFLISLFRFGTMDFD